MRLTLILCCFLGSSYTALAQQQDTLKIRKYSITTSVFDYVTEFKSLNNLTYNVELGLPINARNYIHVSGGYTKSYNIPKMLLSAFNNGKDYHTTGFKTSIEGRHYLGKHQLIEPFALLFWLKVFQYNSVKQANTGYYLAFHSNYHFIETAREKAVPHYDPYYYTEDITVVHKEYATGGYLKLGYNAIKKSGFTVDHAFGMGMVRVRRLSDDPDPDTGHNPLPNQDKIRFDLTYTFKIGWSF